LELFDKYFLFRTCTNTSVFYISLYIFQLNGKWLIVIMILHISILLLNMNIFFCKFNYTAENRNSFSSCNLYSCYL